MKGIEKAMLDMMVKVEGDRVEGESLHDAWKWVKGVVWEYEAIKKKALQWKKVYDSVRFEEES